MADRQFFCDESGINSGCAWFAIGMLSTASGTRRALLDRMAAVRAEIGFGNEVHFEKFSPLRQRAYRRMLEETLPFVQYRTIVVRRADVQLDRFGREWYIAINFFTKRLVEFFVAPGLDAMLFLDDKNRQTRDNGLAYLLREVNLSKPGALRAVEVLDSKDSELMQVSDLYLGLLRFGYEWGWPLHQKTAEMPEGESRKQRFYADFVRLVVRQRKLGRFRVWEWTPPSEEPAPSP